MYQLVERQCVERNVPSLDPSGQEYPGEMYSIRGVVAHRVVDAIAVDCVGWIVGWIVLDGLLDGLCLNLRD